MHSDNIPNIKYNVYNIHDITVTSSSDITHVSMHGSMLDSMATSWLLFSQRLHKLFQQLLDLPNSLWKKRGWQNMPRIQILPCHPISGLLQVFIMYQTCITVGQRMKSNASTYSVPLPGPHVSRSATAPVWICLHPSPLMHPWCSSLSDVLLVEENRSVEILGTDNQFRFQSWTIYSLLPAYSDHEETREYRCIHPSMA